MKKLKEFNRTLGVEALTCSIGEERYEARRTFQVLGGFHLCRRGGAVKKKDGKNLHGFRGRRDQNN